MSHGCLRLGRLLALWPSWILVEMTMSARTSRLCADYPCDLAIDLSIQGNPKSARLMDYSTSSPLELLVIIQGGPEVEWRLRAQHNSHVLL